MNDESKYVSAEEYREYSMVNDAVYGTHTSKEAVDIMYSFMNDNSDYIELIHIGDGRYIAHPVGRSLNSIIQGLKN